MRYRYGVTMGSFFFGAVIPISSMLSSGCQWTVLASVPLGSAESPDAKDGFWMCRMCQPEHQKRQKMSVWVAG
jgi:hypothetical protein